MLQKSIRKCAEYILHKNYFHAETLLEARRRSSPVKLITVSSFTRLGGPYTVSKQVMWWIATMVGPNSVQTVDLVSSFCWSRGKLCENFFLSKKTFFGKFLQILVIRTNLLHAKNTEIAFDSPWAKIWWILDGTPIKIRSQIQISAPKSDAESSKSAYFCPRWVKINFSIFCV